MLGARCKLAYLSSPLDSFLSFDGIATSLDLEGVHNPFLRQCVSELSVPESVGEVSDQPNGKSDKSLWFVLVGEGPVKELENSGHVWHYCFTCITTLLVPRNDLYDMTTFAARLEGSDDADIRLNDTLSKALNVINHVVVVLARLCKCFCIGPTHKEPHLFWNQLASLLQDSNGAIQERHECGTNGKRNISEACENRNLHASVQSSALQGTVERGHKALGICNGMLAKGSANVSNDTDGRLTELRVFGGVDSIQKRLKERPDIWLQILLNGCIHLCQ